MFKVLTSIFVSSVLTAVPARAEVNLVMVEEPGCIWCTAWTADIGPVYPKTGEGYAAPLLRMDKSDQERSDIRFERPLVFTPTFVLVIDGVEAGRLEGYPGEDFFWGLLGQMLSANDIDFDLRPVTKEGSE